MKKIVYSLFTLLIMLTQTACNNGEKNSILKESNAPFAAPEFEQMKVEDYKEAFDRGFAEKRADIKAIIENADAPTFANTIDALEMSGKTLDKVSSLFFTLNESDNTELMTEIENYVVPKMTELSGYVYMNDTLFNRIRTLYDSKETLGLNEEQSIVLENYYMSFVRGGALLNETDKAALLDIDTKLGLASIKFSTNLLADNKAFKLVKTVNTVGFAEFSYISLVIKVDYEGIVLRSALCLIYFLCRVLVESVCTQTVNRFCGKHHKTAVAKNFGSLQKDFSAFLAIRTIYLKNVSFHNLRLSSFRQYPP